MTYSVTPFSIKVIISTSSGGSDGVQPIAQQPNKVTAQSSNAMRDKSFFFILDWIRTQCVSLLSVQVNHIITKKTGFVKPVYNDTVPSMRLSNGRQSPSAEHTVHRVYEYVTIA